MPNRSYAAALLHEHRRAVGDNGCVEQGLQKGMDKGYFLSRKARLNGLLKQRLGLDAALYAVSPQGKRPCPSFLSVEIWYRSTSVTRVVHSYLQLGG